MFKRRADHVSADTATVNIILNLISDWFSKQDLIISIDMK